MECLERVHFRCKKLEYVELPEFKRNRKDAFKNCKALRAIKIPGSGSLGDFGLVSIRACGVTK